MQKEMKTYLILLAVIVRFWIFSCYQEFHCPSRTEWQHRAKWYCNSSSTTRYTCLYNEFKQKYEEACKYEPDILESGEQFIISHLPRGAKCLNGNKYQPFPLALRLSSECLLSKSICNEEGQVLFYNGTSKEDRSCRCDFANGYAFVNRPKHECKCIPALEDCSCYIKHCSSHLLLTSDYLCIHKDNRTYISKCPDMVYTSSENGILTLNSLLLPKTLYGNDTNFAAIFVLILFGAILGILALFGSSIKFHYRFCVDCNARIDTLVGTPYNLKVRYENMSLKFTWSKPQTGSEDIEGYNLHVFVNSTTIHTLKIDGADNLCCYLTSEEMKFKPCTIYRFKISAYTFNSLQSELSKEKIFDTGMPGQVRGLKAFRFDGNGTFTLTWIRPVKTLYIVDKYKFQVQIKPDNTDKDITETPIMEPDYQEPTNKEQAQVEEDVYKEFVLASDILELKFENAQHKIFIFAIYSCCNNILSEPLEQSFQFGHAYGAVMRLGVLNKKVDKIVEEKLDNTLTEKICEIFKNGYKKTEGEQSIFDAQISKGSLLVEIVFTSLGFYNEMSLRNTLKNTFESNTIGEWQLTLTDFSFKALNNPAPPQSVIASTTDSLVTVTWKEPMATFFQTKHYIVHMVTKYRSSVTNNEYKIPAEQMSYSVSNVLPTTRIEFTVYTGICHSIRSRASVTTCIYVEGALPLTDVNDTKRSSSVVLWQTHHRAINNTETTETQFTFKIAKCISDSLDEFIYSEGRKPVHSADITDTETSVVIRKSTHHDIVHAQVHIQDREYDSIWLYEILETIGMNDAYRKISQRACIFRDILLTFDNSVTCYNIGSVSEGTHITGHPHHLTIVECDDTITVIDDMANAHQHRLCLLIVTELDTPLGYVKLQLVLGGVPCTRKDYLHIMSIERRVFTTDKSGRVFIIESPHKSGRHYDQMADTVISYRCKSWPNIANEWLSRYRLHGWPTEDDIQEYKLLGFFVVREGHPLSTEKDLEWRVSFPLQERKLMFNLEDVQHKCYMCLKVFNENILCMKGISLYHWKTCLFYVIEQNIGNVWKSERLFYCVRLCVEQMLKWVKSNFCPDYFIPRINLFQRRLVEKSRNTFEEILNNFLKQGFNSLSYINIFPFRDFRGSIQQERWLQKRCLISQKLVFSINTSIVSCVLKVFNHRILEHYVSEQNVRVIENLWKTLDNIKDIDIITGHTTEETQCCFSLLKPYIYTCLASTIAAMAIQHPNHQVRDFLLIESFNYFTKGGFQGTLKFISVLYVLGLYQECECHLDQLDEDYISNSPSLCECRNINYNFQVEPQTFLNTSHVSTCVSFLPTELAIIPDAMKFELFRHVGIPLSNNERTNVVSRWHYIAVIDSNIYFFLLKYLVKSKLRRIYHYLDAISSITRLMEIRNVRHRDVAYNLLAWIMCSEGDIATGLRCLILSWQETNSLHLYNLNFTEYMNQKYQYNSAKLHALVVIYNTWFAKKQTRFYFCFQCLKNSSVNLKQCARCKKSTYCSKQCQRQNWRIHRKICEKVSTVS